MRLDDLFHLTGSAVLAHRTRSLLTGLGIAVGIAAVVLLTAIGEGAALRRQGVYPVRHQPDRHLTGQDRDTSACRARSSAMCVH